MSKLADKVRSIWARATDEAAAAVLEGEAAATAAAPGAKDGEGFAIDNSLLAAVTDGRVVGLAVVDGKIVIQDKADLGKIIADMVARQSYYDESIKELTEMSDANKLAIEKLSEADPEDTPAADAAVTLDALTIARAEILAPGVAMVAGVELTALQAAYATDAGKKVIDLLSGGQAPTADNAAALFLPAAELLKAQRAKALNPAAAATGDVKTVDTIAHIKAQSAKIHPLF